MILRFDSTSFSFKIRFADSAESSDLSNLKTRESYYLTNLANNEHERAVVARALFSRINALAFGAPREEKHASIPIVAKWD